jgi:hypothetical protein
LAALIFVLDALCEVAKAIRGMVRQMSAAKTKLVVMDQKKKKTTGKKPRRKKGAAKMREAADKVVGRDCKPIVEALSANGQKGQMQSAKFLYGLAQSLEEAGEGEGARQFRSVATELAMAPEWNGDAAKPDRSDEEDTLAD